MPRSSLFHEEDERRESSYRVFLRGTEGASSCPAFVVATTPLFWFNCACNILYSNRVARRRLVTGIIPETVWVSKNGVLELSGNTLHCLFCYHHWLKSIVIVLI